jgi:3-dehydroquinate synthetase
VGGKTGVNLSLGTTDLHKNAVGSFHQPAAVLIDTRTLHSLPDREFRSGFAECVKHALLAADFDDPALFEWTASSAARLLARDNATLSELILRNVRIKAKVVASDEREELPPSNGGRALLNLGHTFGHAIETLPQLSPTQIASDAPLTHGEAISLGLVAAAQGSVLLGHLDAAAVSAVRDLLRALGLPSAVQSLPDSAEIMGRMMHDKKVASGRLRLVLPYRGNRAKVCDTPPTQAVLGAIDSIRAV